MYEVRKLPLHISHVYIIGFASVIQILVSHMSTISKRVRMMMMFRVYEIEFLLFCPKRRRLNASESLKISINLFY